MSVDIKLIEEAIGDTLYFLQDEIQAVCDENLLEEYDELIRKLQRALDEFKSKSGIRP